MSSPRPIEARLIKLWNQVIALWPRVITPHVSGRYPQQIENHYIIIYNSCVAFSAKSQTLCFIGSFLGIII